MTRRAPEVLPATPQAMEPSGEPNQIARGSMNRSWVQRGRTGISILE